MFETDQQIRYWRSMTDAWLNAMTASVASFGIANSALVDAVSSPTTSDKRHSTQADPATSNPFAPIIEAWSLPMQMMTAQANGGSGFAKSAFAPLAATPQAFAEAMSQSFALANSFMGPAYGGGFSSWTAASPWMPSRQGAWNLDADLMRSLSVAFWNWPAVHWPLYTAPATAAMLSSGVPYAVALPVVRSSLAALDAADAVRLQFVSMMRSAGAAPKKPAMMSPTDFFTPGRFFG